MISSGTFQPNQTYPEFLSVRGELSVEAGRGPSTTGRGGCYWRRDNGAARRWDEGGSYRRGRFGGRGCSGPGQASTGILISTLINSKQPVRRSVL